MKLYVLFAILCFGALRASARNNNNNDDDGDRVETPA